MWAVWPEVLKHYAKHYQTGEPMPPALLEKVLAMRKFNQGFATTEYLAAALLDQAWHQLRPDEVPTDTVAFEAAALHRAGVDFAPVPPRYHSTYFSHIFASPAYSAGYYSYIWAEVLDADSVEWFKAHGGLTRANGDHLRADGALARRQRRGAHALPQLHGPRSLCRAAAETPRPRARRPRARRESGSCRCRAIMRWITAHKAVERIVPNALEASCGQAAPPNCLTSAERIHVAKAIREH